jgi:hypothetical protein
MKKNCHGKRTISGYPYVIGAYLLLVITLASCGGGSPSGNNSVSGNNSSTSNSDFSIIFSKESVLITDWIGETIEFQTTGNGDPGVPEIYVYASVSGAGAPVIDVRVLGNVGYFELDLGGGLWSGEYSGEILVSICSDLNCKLHLADSPYTVPYLIDKANSFWRIEPQDVDAVPLWDQKSISVVAEEGVPAIPVAIRTEYAENLVNYTLPQDLIDFFSIGNYSSEGFTLTLPDLPAGRYTDTYLITADGSTLDLNEEYQINYVVSPAGISPAEFVIFEDQVNFRAQLGYGANTGIGEAIVEYYLPVVPISSSLNFTIDYMQGSDWLEASTPGGSSIRIDIIPAFLSAGTYEAEVTAEINGLSDTIGVSLEVYEGVIPSGSRADFRLQTADIGTHLISVEATEGTPELNWTASTDTLWLFIDPRSLNGTVGEFLTLSVDPELVAQLPNNIATTGIVVLAFDNNDFAPVEFYLDLYKVLPEIYSISQNEVNFGESFDITLYGVNFESGPLGVSLLPKGSSSIEQAIDIETIKIISDTEIQISHGDIIAPGEYDLFIPSEPERQTGWGIPFVPRQSFTVLAANSSNKVWRMLSP